jgi:hypothetical protein
MQGFAPSGDQPGAHAKLPAARSSGLLPLRPKNVVQTRQTKQIRQKKWQKKKAGESPPPRSNVPAVSPHEQPHQQHRAICTYGLNSSDPSYLTLQQPVSHGLNHQANFLPPFLPPFVGMPSNHRVLNHQIAVSRRAALLLAFGTSRPESPGSRITESAVLTIPQISSAHTHCLCRFSLVVEIKGAY